MSRHDGSTKTRLERRLTAVVAGWALLLAANNSLPYLGLRDDSCQTMFSSLGWGEHWNSHYLVPQRMVSDLWLYLEVSEVEIEPDAPAGDRRLRWIAEWLEAPDRIRNTEAIRVAVDQLCRAGHRVSLAVRRVDRPDDPVARHENACRVPSLSSPHRWIPVRLYETDLPAPPPPWREEDAP